MRCGCGCEEGGTQVTLACTRPDLSPPSHSGRALATTFPALPPSSANPDLVGSCTCCARGQWKGQAEICSGMSEDPGQLCLTLCDPMDCSTPGLPVHHQLLEFTQTHVHRVSDAIQPSHPLSSPSPALNLSQHQGLFK